MTNPHGEFTWYELITTDVTAAKAFYADVIGWDVHDASTPDMDYVLFSAGNATVAGVIDLRAVAGATPRWIGYIGVNDVDATVEQVEQLGGAVQGPPIDVLDTSRFAVVTDPEGARFGLFKWLTAGRQQPREPGGLRHVSWHELFAGNWEEAFVFYAALFGWRKADTDVGPMGAYQLFAAGEQAIGGMFTKPPAVPVPFWLYYFSVGDVDAATSRVKAGGGQVLEGPIEIPSGNWVVRCTDPQGAMFSLEGKRSSSPIGYFKRAAPGDSPGARSRRFIG